MSDVIDRQMAIEIADAIWMVTGDKNVAKVWQQLKDLPSAQPEIIRCEDCKFVGTDREILERLPSAQPEIIRCKDCKYGEKDEIGRWYCRSLGCQMGDDDGSGFCSDAERREEGGE